MKIMNLRIWTAVAMLVLVCASGAAQSHNRAKAMRDAAVKSGKAAQKQTDEEQISTHEQKLAWADRQYVFGVATSYADSVTMVTMVAPIDSMAYDQNTKTPLGLDLYTDSFRNFLTAQGLRGYMCTTFVCKTEKEAERRLAAICTKVNKRKRTRLVSADGFEYHRIATEHIYTNAGEDTAPPTD